jgi:hypothetical protein
MSEILAITTFDNVYNSKFPSNCVHHNVDSSQRNMEMPSLNGVKSIMN